MDSIVLTDDGLADHHVCVLYIYRTCTGTEVSQFNLSQYHGWWCPGSLRRQDISSHDIDYVE